MLLVKAVRGFPALSACTGFYGFPFRATAGDNGPVNPESSAPSWMLAACMDPRRRAIASVFLWCAISTIAFSTSAQELQKPDAPLPKSEDTPDTLKVISVQAPYEYITGKQRLQWAVVETFGPESLVAGVWSAGIGTARDNPAEYGPHWEGFAKRYGMRFSGVATSNTMEAGLGALWGEDPRYVRNPLLPFKKRVANVFLYSLMARNRNGQVMPAYARYIAIPGNNFLSNTWRVGSDATTNAALKRTGYGIAADICGNAWYEFWPDVKRKVFNR